MTEETKSVQEQRAEYWEHVNKMAKAARDAAYRLRSGVFSPVEGVTYRVSPTTGLQVPIKPKKLRK